MEGRPGEEFYQEGLKRERAKDMEGAIALYRKAAKLGHPLTDLEEEEGEDQEVEQSYSLSLSMSLPERCRECVGPVVVGIGGPTRSGKTTLAESLSKTPGVTIVKKIHQDHYFTETSKMPKVRVHDGEEEKEYSNWEVPESVLWVEFLEEIQRVTQQCTQPCKQHKKSKENEEEEQEIENTTTKEEEKQVIIVEGFLLYCHPLMLQLLDKKIFITLSKEECYNRRMASASVGREYFDKVIWGSYEKYVLPILHEDKKTEFLILNGEDNPQSILAEVINFIST